MAPELVAQSLTLRKAGQDLQKAADDLDREWRAIQGVASSVTFGTDVVASLIGASYQAAHQMAQKTYGSAAQAFSNFGAAIAAMGGVYDKTEQTNTDNVKRLAV
jgi:Excreted virulence factor EspC, type VII ESX diderm